VAQDRAGAQRGAGNLREVGERIERLLEQLGAADPLVQGQAEELVRLLVELYGAGLARIVELALAAEPGGRELLGRMAGDQLVASLLVLHDLHPEPVEARVQQALERVRPYLGSHAGGVQLLGVDSGGVVRLRLEGSCDGCPSSTVTVKLAIERAVEEAAPEVTRVEVEGVTDQRATHGLIPAESLFRDQPAPAGPAAGWVALDGLGATPPGELRAVQADGVAVLACNARGSLYAYRNACPSCASALDAGRLDGERLTCPSCAERFDVRLAGRSLDHPGLHLEPLPLLAEDGGWKVAVAAGAGA
jgi:Fe-S cluster biogenesis protein NfuA/nitrite reductase/ring-hydroxylating ferredoxin subunit